MKLNEKYRTNLLKFKKECDNLLLHARKCSPAEDLNLCTAMLLRRRSKLDYSAFMRHIYIRCSVTYSKNEILYTMDERINESRIISNWREQWTDGLHTPTYTADAFIRQHQNVRLRQYTPRYFLSPAPRQYAKKGAAHATDIGVNIHGFQSGFFISYSV